VFIGRLVASHCCYIDRSSVDPQRQIMKHHLFILALLPLQSTSFQVPNSFSSPLQKNTHHSTTTTALNSKPDTGSSAEDITIEQYSRCLSPSEEKRSIKKEERQYSIVDARPRWQRLLGKFGSIFSTMFTSSSF
jgi:hypothetical protein